MKVKILLLGLFVFSLSGLKAQTYDKTGTLNVCSNHASVIRLGEDVLGLALSGGGGYWDEVDPTDNTKVIAGGVSNIFKALERMPGTYHFVFTAENNPCFDGKALAEVIIVHNPVSSGTTLLLCPDDAPKISLKAYLPAQLSDLAISFADEGGHVVTDGKYDIPSDFEGDINFSYTITEAGYFCNKDANLTLIVKRSVDAGTLPVPEVLSVCEDAIPAQVDLYAILGYRIAGTWSVVASSTSGIIGAAPAPVGSIVTLGHIDLNIVSPAGKASISYMLTPSSACYTTHTPRVSIDITKKFDSNSFKDVEKSICKTSSPKGYVDLMSVLNIQVPANSGVWTLDPGSTSPVDVADGVFELNDARTGIYTVNYKVSNAVGLCDLTAGSATITLNVFDSGEALDGEVQLCGAATGSLPLNKYVVGLPLRGVTWYAGLKAEGTAVVGGSVDVSALETGIYAYTYSYESGLCGSTEGHLYVSVTDGLTNFIDKTIKYCVSDFGSDVIDLDQLLGVFGVSGTWSFDKAGSTSSHADVNSYYNSTTHVFDGRGAASNDRPVNKGKYVFKYTVDSNYSGCIEAGETVSVTVIITEDLTE